MIPQYGVQSVEGVQVLSLRWRLLEVIDQYSRCDLVKGNRAWTNSAEPPQSLPGSLPALVYFLPYFYIQIPVYVSGRLCPRPAELILSSSNIPYDFDPEIELTLRKLRKVDNIVVSTNSSLNTSSTFENSVFATNTTNSSDFSTTNSFSRLNNS
ncbi:hypothetical protein CR513_07903, partial [Mucuna pruriens]